MRGLEAAARQAFDSYLQSDSRRPLAVGLSGGGDSVALTLIADGWAREVGRELLILTVDHEVQRASTAWAATCEALADRLGRPFQALAWRGPKPLAGLPAAARLARHRLLADAAREAGARVILLGHTADDVSEAGVMRQSGSTTPSPRMWSPSPVWPEGRGLFLLRPLLSVRRDAIREALAGAGEPWIDDPSNDDLRYARSRARASGAQPLLVADTVGPLTLVERASEADGIITIARSDLQAAPPEPVRRFVGLACVSAGGGERLPLTARVVRAADALRGADPFVGTLAGARIEADAATVLIFREAGEEARGGLAPVRGPAVWDGRFEVKGPEAVRRLAGLSVKLSSVEREALRGIPVSARGALPVRLTEDGGVSLANLESLVDARLRAAAGLVQREPD